MQKVLALIMLVCCGTTVFAQMQFGSHRTPMRSIVKVVGEYTWFTFDGDLYRKHVDDSVAEVWHRQTIAYPSEDRYRGLLHDSTRVACHYVFDRSNAPLAQATITDIRIDEASNVWMATDHNSVYSLKGTEWTRHDDDKDRVWPGSTPYAGERFTKPRAEKNVIDDTLQASIPKVKHLVNVNCGFGYRPASYAMNVSSDGMVYLSTEEGVHVFLPNDDDKQRTPIRIQPLSPFPNPASTSITFRLPTESAHPMTTLITDLSGRVRGNSVEGTTHSTVVDVTGLEEGVYVAVLKSEGKTATTTFTVRR